MQLDPGWLAAQGDDKRLLSLMLATLRGRAGTGAIGVAVSGGGDSVALLHLALRCANATGLALRAVTVDHSLRAGSADEAAGVATLCDAINVAHDTLVWDTWDGHGNVQAAAREARYGLMANWAADHGVTDILLGHTMDDVAETYVMRLARKAGIDGLARMDRGFARGGVNWHRPMLDVTRADLRAYLARHDLDWAEDPSNDNTDFERVRVRQALGTLDGLGLGTAALGQAALAARQARSALDHYTRIEARTHLRPKGGDLILSDIGALPVEIQRRLWAKAVQWMGRLDYPPRASTIQSLKEGIALSGKATGAGCLITAQGPQMRITREANAVAQITGATHDLWDGYWQLDGPHAPDLRIAALGEGIRDCPGWRDTGLPRDSLMASPAVWKADTLVAAPVAGHNQGWRAQIVADFHQWLDTH